MDLSIFIFSSAAVLVPATVCIAVLWRQVRGLQRRNAALLTSESRFRALIEHAPMPICVSDDHGILGFGNDAYFRLFGLDAGSTVAGRRLLDFFAASQHQLITAVPASCQTIGRRADGGEFPLQLVTTRLDLADGPCLVSFHVDLTDLRRTEAALIAAERDAVLGRMAGRVAHEVNNPLEAIKIYIEPLRKRVQDRPEVARGLTVIDEQVDRIARLVRSLLGFVRQRTLHRSSVRLGEVVHTVGELFQPRFAKKGRTLEVVLPSGPRTGTIDVDAVQQVLINLLENALAAVPAGGWVKVEADCQADGRLHIRVSDNGPGLGPDPESLFRPFVTTKAEGTGLGLTVARRICIAHGGSLTASNLPAGGACFDLDLRVDQTTDRTILNPNREGQPS